RSNRVNRPNASRSPYDNDDSSRPSSASSTSSFFDPYISYRGKEYAIEIGGNDRKKIMPGTYHLSKLKLSGNAALDLQGSPVVLIVRGSNPDEPAIEVNTNAGINTWRNPNNLQIINISTKPIVISDNGQIWARIASTSPILTTRNGRLVSPGSAPFARNWGLEPDPPSSETDDSTSSSQYSQSLGDESPSFIANTWNSPIYNGNSNLISNASLERSDYRNQMAKEIQRCWFQPIGTKERGEFSVVKMQIDRRGEPINVQALTRTDFTAMDSSALAAIKSAGSFAPPTEQVQFTLLFKDGTVQVH
ncbi:MAG: TonB C-terminal domain-containing protein, partial [Candidatus Obscuribacterales bacterium]|nr:TonB C-terminal domain-containing protein [Candidatus Obscuribacterales bacterium]